MKFSLNFCNWQQYQRCPLCKSPPRPCLPHHLHPSFQRPGQQQLYTPLLLSTALQLWPMSLILLIIPQAKNLPCPFPWHLLTSSQSPSPTHLTFRNPKPLPSFVTLSHPQTMSWSLGSHISQQIHTSHKDLRLSPAHLSQTKNTRA